MSYGKKLFRSATRAFSALNVYDETEEKLQSEVNASLKTSLNASILKSPRCPTSGSYAVGGSVTDASITVTGMTANHVVVNWGLYSASDDSPISANNPPADITIAEGSNGYTLNISNITTAFYFIPVFAIPQNLT